MYNLIASDDSIMKRRHGYALREAVASRVSNALGEGPVALGEAFLECNTRGRVPGISLYGKDVFPESQKSCTRRRLSREPS